MDRRRLQIADNVSKKVGLQMQRWRFYFICEQAGKVKGFGGEELHGLLFRWLGKLAPEAATILHNSRVKPFVIGPLANISKVRAGWSFLEKGQQYTFDITFLSSLYYGIAVYLSEHWPEQEFQLGTATIVGVKAELSERASYRSLLLAAEPIREVKITFSTPTSFRQRGTQFLFPMPDKTFGSLLATWNKYSSLSLPEIDFSFLRVNKYRLQTELVLFSRYSIIGFTGWCCYEVPGKTDNAIAQQVACLAAYAPYAGIGYKTPMGLGQVSKADLRQR